MTEPTIGTGTPNDFTRMVAHFDLVFGEAPNDEGLDNFKQWLEFDRVILAEDAGELVGTAGANSYRVTVPGGDTVAAAGLTIVAVRPTHRRSGLLRRMMRRHLEDVRDRGEAASMLYASESSIYGRFGYGSAAPSGEISLQRSHGAFRRDIPAARGTYRLLDLAAADAIMRQIHPLATAGVPGALVLREPDWVRRMVDYPSRREGHTPWRVLIYDRDGEPRGYARYRQKDGWGDGGPEGTVAVRDVQALDGEAFVALWRFLLDIDLSMTIAATHRPVPDPLRLLLADPRRLVEKSSDGLWVRPLDVPALLAARRYRVPGSVVIEVSDEFFEAGGRYQLEGGPDGATCEPTAAAAEISLGVEQLGAVYLGGQALDDLAWVGLIQGDAAAIRRANDMFSWPITPHNTLHF